MCLVVTAQCRNGTYCGTACCGDTETEVRQGRTACCVMGVNCCTPSDFNRAEVCEIGGGALKGCPGELAVDEVYDRSIPPQLRNQCCQYFQSGCCSQAENNTLVLL